MGARCCNRLKMLALLIVCITFPLSFAAMKEACDLQYLGDISELKDSTIKVPDKVVSMSAKIKVEMPFCTTQVIGGTPSILFVIDHSGSMFQTSSNPNDRWGQRFLVAQTLMDTLKKTFPKLEAGIAVFRQYLYFYAPDNNRFVKWPLDSGAYLPFFRFDSSYAPDGKLGYQIVRELLDTASYTSPNTHVGLKYTPTNPYSNSTSTNINVCFQVVKDLFQRAAYPANRQFVIFISDGDATYPLNNPDQFVEDVKSGVPTTLTVFLTTSTDPNVQPPQTLRDMTTNIQNNGYSTTNIKSRIWAINVSNLMTLMLKEIKTIIFTTGQSKPLDITVNGSSINVWDSINQVFTLPTRLPLTGPTTDFSYKINYKIVRDSIDTMSGDTIPVVKDSTTEGSYKVVVDPTVTNPPTSPPYKHAFELICWKRDLQFYYNNLPITYVNETMNPIQLRYIYSPDEAQYHYTKANIEVTNTAGVIKDKETYALTKSDTTFSGSFQRVLISNVTNPNIGNTILQHQVPDTFVATFRNEENPKLPLDTIWAKVPFRLTGSIDILRGYYYDDNADGYVDSIYVVLTTDLAGGLTINHVNQIKDSIILPAFRKLTIDGQGVTAGGFYLKVTESKSNNPTTYVTKDDSLIVKGCILPGGGWMIGKKAPIYDKIAPLIHWTPRKAFMVDNIIDTMYDTLGVTFSETVRYITSKEPFYIKSIEDSSIFTPLLTPVSQPRPDSMVFVVDRNNTKSMKDGDSIWIHEGSRVGDVCMSDQGAETYNYQNNANNTRRRLYVDKKSAPFNLIPNSISPIDLNNLVSPVITDPIIIQTIKDSLGNQFINSNNQIIGMLITLIPDFSDTLLIPKNFQLKGNITIFDAVGNTVSPRSKMAWIKGKGLFWIWNCKNSNNRTVGPGMYLSIIEWENVTPTGDKNKGEKGVKRLFVGVKE